LHLLETKLTTVHTSEWINGDSVQMSTKTARLVWSITSAL